MIAIGNDDARKGQFGQLSERGIGQLDWIDQGKTPLSVAMAVEKRSAFLGRS